MVSVSLRLAKNVNAGSSSWSFASFLSKKRRDEVGNAFLTPIFASMPLDGQGARLPAGPAREATGIRPGRSAEVIRSVGDHRGSVRVHRQPLLGPCSSGSLPAVRCTGRVKAMRLRLTSQKTRTSPTCGTPDLRP